MDNWISECIEKAKREKIIKEFQDVINRHSLENISNTPDWMLAQQIFDYLLGSNWTVITGDVNSLPPSCTIVLGYNPAWIDEDFEPEGIRECFMDDDQDGWNSCKWDNDADHWRNDTETKPTHWMQRPSPPQTIKPE